MINIKEYRCDFCTACVTVCPPDCIEVREASIEIDNEICIDCDLCRETAPDNFTRQEEGGYSYLYKQPENDEEKELCEEALEGCPVEAIGDDGHD